MNVVFPLLAGPSRCLSASPLASKDWRAPKKPGVGLNRSDSNNHNNSNNNSASREPKPRLGTKATWLVIYDVPPLATLDDVLEEIQRVVTTELNRGMIDLTRTESLLYDTWTHSDIDISSKDEEEQTHYSLDTISEADVDIGVNISLQEDDDEDDQLDEDDQGDEEGDSRGRFVFPLWTPSSFTQSNVTLPHHLVLEAHIMLSTLARPMGWYLKFPDRSVVHAILKHLEEAEKLRETFKKDQKRKRMQRKKELKNKTNETLDYETYNNAPNFIEYDNDSHPHELFQDADKQLFSWKSHTTRPLICAGKELHVAPFYFMEQIHTRKNHTTHSSISSSSTYRQFITPPIPTKQDVLSVPNMFSIPFYHPCKTFVDETVLRLENCSMDSTVDDVRYFFRRFDLKHDPKSSIPSILLIGGPLFIHGHREDVSRSQSHEEQFAGIDQLENPGNTKHSKDQTHVPSTANGFKIKTENKGPTTNKIPTITPLTTQTFLVRFQASADARAAIRELQFAEFMGKKIKLAQYSNPLKIEE